MLEGSLGNNDSPTSQNYIVRSFFRKIQASEIIEFLKILLLLFKCI